MNELRVLGPHDSDLYPTSDERVEIEKIIGRWETYESEVSGSIHLRVRSRALKAFRAGYALREEDLQKAFNRGYREAEDEVSATIGCCCGDH